MYERLEKSPEPPDGGCYVIVDVLRFSTTACYLWEKGIRSFVPVDHPEEGRRLKKQQGFLLVGEQYSEPIDGFDLTNSPAHIREADLSKSTAAVLTTNGTRALRKCAGYPVVAGAPVIHSSLVDHLRQQPATIHIVACGSQGVPTEEDSAYSRFLAEEVTDQQHTRTKEQVQQMIRESEHARDLKKKGYRKDVHIASSFNTLSSVPHLTTVD